MFHGIYEAAQDFQKQGMALSSSNVTFDSDGTLILDTVATVRNQDQGQATCKKKTLTSLQYSKVSERLLSTMIGKITTSQSGAIFVKPQGYQVLHTLDTSDDVSAKARASNAQSQY